MLVFTTGRSRLGAPPRETTYSLIQKTGPGPSGEARVSFPRLKEDGLLRRDEVPPFVDPDLPLPDPDLPPGDLPPLAEGSMWGPRDRARAVTTAGLLLGIPTAAIAGSRLGFVPGALSGLGVAGVGYLIGKIISRSGSSTATGAIAPAGLMARYQRMGARRRRAIPLFPLVSTV